MLQHFVYSSLGISMDLVGLAAVLAFAYLSCKKCNH